MSAVTDFIYRGGDVAISDYIFLCLFDSLPITSSGKHVMLVT